MSPEPSAHPHAREYWTSKNTIYVATDRFEISGRTFPGSGVFSRAYKLSAQDADRPTIWSAPAWLNPNMGGTGLSYHAPHRWTADGRLQAASRGQEFVSDIGGRTDAEAWIADLLEGYI